MTDPNLPSTELCYPVLTPFKFEGVIVKPPAFLQLSEEDAAPYIADEVLGADGIELPDEASAVIVAAGSEPITTTTGANPAGGAPPAGKAGSRKAVVRKSTKRK